MPTNLQLFIQGFNDQEKAIADFKERIKQLSIKSGPLKMFIDAYIQDENADVSVAAKIGTLINNGWFMLDGGDERPDDWSDGFDSFDDNKAYLHLIQRVDNGYKGQTLMVQFKGNKIGIISYMDGFTMGMPQSKWKSHD
jgi:hypothetical protein